MSDDRSATHILTCAQTLRGGGVERVLLRLAADWLSSGRRVTLVLGSAEGPLRAELPDGLDIDYIGSPRWLALAQYMPDAVRRHRPDVVFCPGNHYTIFAWWVRRRLRADCPPIVAKMSNTFDRVDMPLPVRLGYEVWLRHHPRFLDGLVAMTPATAAEAFARTGIPVSKLSIIPNPPPRLAPAATPAPTLAGRYLLGVGRLAPQKRWERLVSAMASVTDPLVSLAVLGEGVERSRLEAQVQALGMGHRITLPGHVADPAPLIAGAAAVVLVSDFEGVPGVLREALALGTPVITTDSSVATREIVSEPAFGTVVPAGDQGALVAAIDQWLAPDAVRPTPVTPPGEGAATAYLQLFDGLVAGRSDPVGVRGRDRRHAGSGMLGSAQLGEGV